MRRMPRLRAGIVAASFLLLSSLLLIACGGNGAPSSAQAVVPPSTATSVPYLPPTVVPATPTATATATPTHPPNTSPPPPPPSPPPGPNPVGGVPNIGGQLILVSLSQQWLWAYQDHRLYYRTPVTTGMPQLATPDGMFYIHYKETNVTFISPGLPARPTTTRLSTSTTRCTSPMSATSFTTRPGARSSVPAPTTLIRTPMACSGPAATAAWRCRRPLANGSTTGPGTARP